MIFMGGSSYPAGLVATKMNISADVPSMDTSQITITPSMSIEDGVISVEAAANIPSGFLSSSVRKTSGRILITDKTESKTITANGTYTPSSGKLFNSITVNVGQATPSAPNLQAKTVDAVVGGSVITPTAGYDGLSKVTINPLKLQNKSVTPTSTAQTVTADSGYHGLKQVTVSGVTSSSSSTKVQTKREISDTEFSSNMSASWTITPTTGYDAMASVTMPDLTKYCKIGTKSAGTVSPDKVLSGVTYQAYSSTNNSFSMTQGTMANNGAVALSLSAKTPTAAINQGYHSGSGSASVATATSALSISSNGTYDGYDANGAFYTSISVNIPASASASIIDSVTLSADNDMIVKALSTDSRKFSIDSIIDGYTLQPPKKSTLARYDGMAKVIIPPLASWTDGDKLIDIRDMTKLDLSTSKVLNGSLYYVLTDSGLQSRLGTMTNNAAVTGSVSPTSPTYTIPEGYHNGSGKITLNLNMNAYYVGTSAPTSSLGNDGDIYLKMG